LPAIGLKNFSVMEVILSKGDYIASLQKDLQGKEDVI
jgi:hypothetical protein